MEDEFVTEDDYIGKEVRRGYKSGDICWKEEAGAALDLIFLTNRYLKSSLFDDTSGFWKYYEIICACLFLFVVFNLTYFHQLNYLIIILLPILFILIKKTHTLSVEYKRMKAACLFADLELQSFLKDVMDALKEEIEKENIDQYCGDDFKEFNDKMYDKSKYHQFDFPIDARDYLFKLWVLWKNDAEKRNRL